MTRSRCKGDDDELSNAMHVVIHNLLFGNVYYDRIGIYSMIILNGDGLETHYKNNNITHLCFCLGLSLGLPSLSRTYCIKIAIGGFGENTI